MRPPIELFPLEGVDLASDARKLYYKELVSFAREKLLGIPDGYLQHLKSLFFEGAISLDPWIAFRSSSPLLICLSAPSISRDFVVSTFDAYDAHCAYYDLELYRMHIFRKAEQRWPLVVARLECVVEYLADENSRCASSERYGLRSHYLSLYYKIFYRYKSGGDIKVSLAQSIIEYVERNFEAIQSLEDSCGTMVAFPKAFLPILSGEVYDPESAYLDPLLLGFLQRFFAKKLPPTLQAIVEGIYTQLERPIKLVDGRVEY